MAGLPLYLMAIPLRKSLAAGMDACKRGGGVYTQLLPAQPSGERMRLACWFRRRAETNFNLISVPQRTNASAKGKFAIAGTCSPTRETRAPQMVAATLYNNFNRVRSCESTMPTGTLSSSITTRSSMR
jgi:hypothetical protein